MVDLVNVSKEQNSILFYRFHERSLRLNFPVYKQFHYMLLSAASDFHPSDRNSLILAICSTRISPSIKNQIFTYITVANYITISITYELLN